MSAIVWNKSVNLDKLKLRKFEGEITHYFMMRENVWIQISEQLYWRITRYQMRNKHKPDDNLYILGMTNINTKNSFGTN